MATFIIYMIRWAVTLTLLYSLYGLFLRKETFHRFNRALLMLIFCVSTVLPLCQFDLGYNTVASDAVHAIENYIDNAADSELVMVENEASEGAVQEATVQSSDAAPSLWIFVCIGIYAVGVLVAWSLFLRSLLSLCIIIARGRRIRMDGVPENVHVIISNRVKLPFSWMHWIVLSPSDLSDRPDMVVRHEMSHIHLRHSWDMLLCELTCRMQWCNPFVWMMRTDLRDLHEYEADREVLCSGVNEDAYQHLLIRKATVPQARPIVNSLSASGIKKRFVMMLRQPSNRLARLKALYVLPLMAFVVVCFAKPTISHDVAETLVREEHNLTQTITQSLNDASKPSLTEETDLETSVEEVSEETEVKPENKSDNRPTVASDGNPIYYSMPANSKKNILYGGVSLKRTAEETLVTCVTTCEKDDEYFWFGGDQTYIEDTETGTFYKARRPIGIDHFTGFHLAGMKGQTWALTMVFPPLPSEVHKIRFWHLCSWLQIASYDLKDIEE